MGYNVIDLINKTIKIANWKKTMYESIGQGKCGTESIPIQLMSNVLAKDIDKTIKYYEELKDEVNKANFEEIDFYIYDKISFLIDQFNKKICVTDINNVKGYLKFSLNLERDCKSLLIDIQGRYVQNTSDIQTKTYNILSDMIIKKEYLITSLEKIIKK